MRSTLGAESAASSAHVRCAACARPQTTFLFRDGAELWRHEGLASARELVQAACSRALSAEEAEVLLLEQPQWR